MYAAEGVGSWREAAAVAPEVGAFFVQPPHRGTTGGELGRAAQVRKEGADSWRGGLAGRVLPRLGPLSGGRRNSGRETDVEE